MSRRPDRSHAVRVRALLDACADWPYARAPELRALSGLRRHEFTAAVRAAGRSGLIDSGKTALDGRMVRLALTPAGYESLDRKVAAATLTACWLASARLDVARRLVAECAHDAASIWSLSPFTLPAEALFGPRPGRLSREVIQALRAEGRVIGVRRLRLDALACLRFGPERYRNIAVLVDPGGVALDWFTHQFRAYHAWVRRGEFAGRFRALPVLIVVAAQEATRGLLAALWRDAAGRRGSEARLRAITHAGLGERWAARRWVDERGPLPGLWAGLAEAERPSRKPGSHCAAWYAEFDFNPPTPAAATHSTGKTKSDSLLAWAQRYWSQHGPRVSVLGLRAQLVQAHRALSPTARAALRAIGRYPTLAARDLAAVLAVRGDHIATALQALTRFSLVERLRDSGYALTGAGVALHAGWARLEPVDYAALMRWPVRVEARRLVYSADAWREHAAHTRLILRFLVGLRRHGPRHGLRLVIWDHVRCESYLRGHASVVIPDAVGVVRTKDAACEFWLEVDRSTRRGAALWAKLDRYYLRPAPAPRVLIVVERDDEARLQALRRRLRALDARHHARLDVRLARADQMEITPGDLDPGRPVWREVYGSALIPAFE